MPLIFNEFKGEIKELIENKEKYFKSFDRIRLEINKTSDDIKKISLENFKSESLSHINNNLNNSFLFVFNTISSSVDFYGFLKNNISNRKLFYLSSNIIPLHRKAIIDEIKKTNETKDNNFIIISTQVIEAGVDIDIDIVYRDFGPLDSINQVAGRCNRNSINNKGIVKIVRIENENHKEYNSFIYDKTLLLSTINTFLEDKNSIIKEKDFYSMNRIYFSQVNKMKSDDISDIILQNINNLQYNKAFSLKDKGKEEKKSVFKLIDDNYDSIDVFIELDNNAKKLYCRYEELNELPIFERKKFFAEFKKDFLSYIISIPKKYFYKNLEGFKIPKLSYDEIEVFYCIKTGYIRKDHNDFFI